jgi:hypothetical protein
MDIVISSLVNNNGQGIAKYQNRVCKELFCQGKNGKNRSLILFDMYGEKPIITFYKEGKS